MVQTFFEFSDQYNNCLISYGQFAEPMQALHDSSNVIQNEMKKEGKVRSACSLCQNCCGLFSYVSDGKIVKLEGDPGNPHSMGHLCAKGLSGFLNAYSPRRVTKPLMRMNSEKKLGVDPQWKEIPWEEALEIVARKLRESRERSNKDLIDTVLSGPLRENYVGSNPSSQRIIFDTFDYWTLYGGMQMAWANALDAYLCILSADCYCGNAVHPPSYLNTSTFEPLVDAEYSKYVLLVGSQAGSIIHYNTMKVAKHFAEQRPGNIKVVSVDPMAGYAASVAEEWVPIRPGTDAAFLLGIISLLLNEYEIYDRPFLKNKTNGSYLIDDDGRYIRDQDTNKPMVWDEDGECAKVFDDRTIRNPALHGSYIVDGKKCRPSFLAVKDYVKKYNPEYVSGITTIPAETIRRLAKEIGEAACVGQTIEIDGKVLPYRPFSFVWYRGLSAHKHSFLAGMAAMMLPTILGAIQVPGSIYGAPQAKESETQDGLMTTDPSYGIPYPPRPVTKPRRVDIFELFPVATYSHHLFPIVLNDPEKFGINPKDFVYPEIMFVSRENAVKNTYSPSDLIRGLSKIPFIVTFNVELDETANSLADIVLPDLHHLERLGEAVYGRIDEPGFWYGAKPVVKPPFEPPWDNLVSNAEILLILAEKAGFLTDTYHILNTMWKLKGTQYELDTSKKYSYEELIDRRLKSLLGPDKGIDWLMSDEGGLIVGHASVEELYRGAFRKARIHLYNEFMIGAKKDLEKTLGELGFDWWDTSDYQPIPDWKPCTSYTERDSEYNLFMINYKIPVMAHSVGRSNPIAMQLVAKRKHLDSLLLNPNTAGRLGISEGDEVWVEDKHGHQQKSIASLSERIHPEVVATSQHNFRRGIDFNKFTEVGKDSLDFVGNAIDSCILVKVFKEAPVGGSSAN